MSTFASPEWAEQLGAQLQDSARVRTESVTWIHGPLAIVVDADAELGIDATTLRLDVHEGSVRAVDVVSSEATARCPFAIAGSLARWKAVFGGSQSLVDGILESRLRSRGDLPTIVRHRGLFDAIAASGGELETTWQDDEAAQPAAAKA